MQLKCHIGDCYVGCIYYADDLILLSGSLTQLQAMLQVCDRHAQSMDLIFNCRKSCLFKAGVGFNENIINLHLNGGDVGWVDKLKYLGIYILRQIF